MILDRLGLMATQRVLAFHTISSAVNELFVSVVTGGYTTYTFLLEPKRIDMIIMKDRVQV